VDIPGAYYKNINSKGTCGCCSSYDVQAEYKAIRKIREKAEFRKSTRDNFTKLVMVECKHIS